LVLKRKFNLETGATAALLALAALLFFFHLGCYGLWEPDEGRYAEIPREMLASGDFILPHLNYVAYVEKPPLLYWLTALSFHLFGQNELGARMVPALSALFGVLATYLFALRVFDRRRAILAGAILATSPLYAALAQVLTTDMLLATLMTIAFFSFFLAWRDGGRWRWAFYGAMGLGVLTKGPIGVVLPIIAALVFLWWQGQLRTGVKKLRPVSGLLLTVAIAAPWFVAVAIRMPDFVWFYFVGEHFRRFFQATYSHGEPIYFYIPVLLAGLFPWSLAGLLSGSRGSSNPARSFCLITASVALIFFSVASSKLIPYILPAIPPIALLIADAILSLSPAGEIPPKAHADGIRRLRFVGLFASVVGAGTLAVVLFGCGIGGPYLTLGRPALIAIGTILVAGGVLTAGLFSRRRLETAVLSLTLTSAAALLAGSYGRLAVEPMRSYAQLSRSVAIQAPGAVLICYHRYIQALPFYTGRRVILVGSRSELGFGAAHSADAGDYFFASDADLVRLWNRPIKSVLLIDQPDLDRLRPALGNIRVIASEHKKRAVVKADSEVGNPPVGASPPTPQNVF
jgi:4-amino-4-deoxy-L-arabinose transferase-like glycosyltransferase